MGTILSLLVASLPTLVDAAAKLSGTMPDHPGIPGLVTSVKNLIAGAKEGIADAPIPVTVKEAETAKLDAMDARLAAMNVRVQNAPEPNDPVV